eukprot:TRINITY_DN2928_c0_g1_i1.p2 TRINITY_DN2928_c0_g1~~TRINITY_DN2928_c0_g1_i1.p2  ORF type:complete len:262 (+),score=53.58 TRINITY_DN2928_c0_g1_i1:1085-1870(+)
MQKIEVVLQKKRNFEEVCIEAPLKLKCTELLTKKPVRIIRKDKEIDFTTQYADFEIDFSEGEYEFEMKDCKSKKTLMKLVTKKSKKRPNLSNMNDLDAQIAALEAGLDESESESDDDNVLTDLSSDEDLDESIEEEELPKEKNEYPCVFCKMQFTSMRSLVEHQHGRRHREMIALKKGLSFNEKRKELCCRPCEITFESLEEFENHRKSTEHNKGVKAYRWKSYCQDCKKQFTSPEQLVEHEKGKAHKHMKRRSARGSHYM